MNWLDYHMGIAKMVSAKSTCPSRQVGAVLVDPETNIIIATGYNGAPRGLPHCGPECSNRQSGGDWGKCNALHAELNVIIACALAGKSTKGAWLYLTTTPCVFCARAIVNAGVARVLATSAYPHAEAIEMLAAAGIETELHTGVPLPKIRYRYEYGVTEGGFTPGKEEIEIV